MALTSICLTAILMLLAVSWSLILLSPFSTPAMMSTVGVFFGGTAKLSPLVRTVRSSSDSWRWLRLMMFSVLELEIFLPRILFGAW